MQPGSLHPAYLAAPAANQWREGLPALWKFLEKMAAEHSPKVVGVVLPHGARVQLKKPADGPRQLKIFRREPFATANGSTKWIVELATFRREFGCNDWTVEHGIMPEGGPWATFTERVRTMDFFNAEE